MKKLSVYQSSVNSSRILYVISNDHIICITDTVLSYARTAYHAYPVTAERMAVLHPVKDVVAYAHDDLGEKFERLGSTGSDWDGKVCVTSEEIRLGTLVPDYEI